MKRVKSKNERNSDGVCGKTCTGIRTYNIVFRSKAFPRRLANSSLERVACFLASLI